MTATATVEVLTAEVRVLMVGSRQVTLSVAKQLDEVEPEDIQIFGRICMGSRLPFGIMDQIEVIGSAGGVLVRSKLTLERYLCGSRGRDRSRMTYNGVDAICLTCPEHRHVPDVKAHFWTSHPFEWDEWEALPLIVLAGLR
jgi:hypothetical protein